MVFLGEGVWTMGLAEARYFGCFLFVCFLEEKPEEEIL